MSLIRQIYSRKLLILLSRYLRSQEKICVHDNQSFKEEIQVLSLSITRENDFLLFFAFRKNFANFFKVFQLI